MTSWPSARRASAEFWDRPEALTWDFARLPRSGDTVFGFAVGLYTTDHPSLPEPDPDDIDRWGRRRRARGGKWSRLRSMGDGDHEESAETSVEVPPSVSLRFTATQVRDAQIELTREGLRYTSSVGSPAYSALPF